MSHDDRHPFDAERFVEGFTEEPARIVHAEDDPVLGEMADRDREAWDAFLATEDDETPAERPAGPSSFPGGAPDGPKIRHLGSLTFARDAIP